MSGHSKWSTIKHKKGATDQKRAKVFTKLIKEVTMAARLGGANPDGNPRLRLAIEKARSQSVPKDNIDRAIKKGTGELGGDAIEEASYEGYGPAGIAIIVDCTTDNKTRTVAEIRNIFAKKGGHLGESGSVAWMFEKKGVIRIDAAGTTEEILFEKALDAGADDIKREEDIFVVTSAFEDFNKVHETLTKGGFAVKEASIEMLPKNTTTLASEEEAQKLMSLIEALEDNDDVQNVWANYDISDDLMEKLAS